MLNISVASLLDFFPVIITFDSHNFAHLVDTGPEADTDTVDQGVILPLKKGISRVFFIFTVIQVVGRKNRQFFVVVSVVDDVKNHFFNPGRRSLSP